MWGAKSGREQLAPFPEPTHAAGFACAVPNSAKQCVVGFTSKEAFDKAHKMVRCWPCCNCCLIIVTLAGMQDLNGCCNLHDLDVLGSKSEQNIIVRAEILLVLAHVAAEICGQNERRKSGRCAESLLLTSLRDALPYLPGIFILFSITLESMRQGPYHSAAASVWLSVIAGGGHGLRAHGSLSMLVLRPFA